MARHSVARNDSSLRVRACDCIAFQYQVIQVNWSKLVIFISQIEAFRKKISFSVLRGKSCTCVKESTSLGDLLQHHDFEELEICRPPIILCFSSLSSHPSPTSISDAASVGLLSETFWDVLIVLWRSPASKQSVLSGCIWKLCQRISYVVGCSTWCSH